MWNLLRRTRKNQKSGRDVREAGWTSLFQAVAEPFSGAWQQGVKADPEAVLSFHAVFACISLISQDIAKMRLRLMQTDAHGIRRETRRGDIARLCRRPNAQQNRIQFFELWLNAKLRHGNTVVLKIRNARGQIKELRILDWNRVEPLVADDGEVFYRITPDRNCGITEAVTVPAREVIHDRFNCFFHPLIGLPPVYAAGLAATQGHHIQENSTSFFRNGGRPSGVIEIPGSITEENAKKLKSNWDSGYTGENAGKTAILSNGAKYNPTTFSPVDAQTVEQLKMTAEIVCSVFRVPAYKIGVGQPPSSDNVEALEQQYYSQCLQTLIESIELLLDEALETGENESTEFDVTTLLRMDSERRMKTLGDAVKNTLLTPNEARKRENLPPLAGGDALYLQQQNYSLEALSRRDAREDPFALTGQTALAQPPDGASDGNKAISETEHDAVKAMFRGDTAKMTERELSIIRALGEEFSAVLADLQRTFEGKIAAQAQTFEEKLASLSVVLQKCVTGDDVRPMLEQMVKEAVRAREETLKNDNADARASNDAELLGYGQGERIRERMRELQLIRDSYRQKDADLQSQYQAGDISEDFYRQALAQNAQYLSERLKEQEAFYARSDEQRADWQKGLQEGVSNWVDSASDYASQAAQLATDGISGMVNNITEMLNGNKVEWRSWAASILQEISKVLMNAAIVNGIKMAANSMSGAGGFFGSIGNWLGGAVANAKGGVYTSANLSAYSNSIVDTPTYFAFAKGAGLMGEAGPEAIMPLTRAADGSLGVRAVGSMNGSAGLVYSPVYHIAIQNDGANGQIGPEAAGTLVQLIDQRVQAVMLSMRRDGGMLSG
ncbi:phage portal protein [Escherichia coli]|nr:phage portal protein [Escherichia coli]